MSEEQLTVVGFTLGDRRFGIASDLVVEVLPMLPIRTLPGAPPAIVGVTSVRGQLLPLLDPGPRLGFEPCSVTPSSYIVSVRAADKRLGLVVDGADDVFSVPWKEVCKPGDLEPAVPYGIGLVKHGSEDVVLVDLDALVNHDEWVGVHDAVRRAG